MEPTTPLLIRDFAIALFIGALVGIEREGKRIAGGDQGIGGIRTFTLFALAGAVSGWLTRELAAPLILVATVGGVSAAVVAAYLVEVRSGVAGVGLTTEIAAIVVTLLGGLTLVGYPAIAVALGIATSAILAFKEPLHGFVGKIGRDDLYAGLKLLIATFIILPVLPRETIDPLDAINPSRLWLLVILIAGLSLLGYVAVRMLGTERGTAVTGVFGGLVSSTAVTLAFSRQSKEDARAMDIASALAAGILLAWLVMFIRVFVEIAVVYAPLIAPVLLPLGVMTALCLGFAAVQFWRGSRASRATAEQTTVPLTNPFSLTSAVKFAAAFAVVLVLVKLAERYTSSGGLYLVAGLAGLTDMDAITLSMANYARDGGELATARNSIVLAAMANTAVKAGFVATLGTPALRRRIGVGALALLAVGVIALVA